MEISGKAKPLTSFFIDDILSFKDSSGCGKCCLQEQEQDQEQEEEQEKRSPRWEAEPQMVSEELCPQESERGQQSGERPLKFLSFVQFRRVRL